jgi:hypothetical protein
MNLNYKSTLEFRRTPEEKKDQFLSWAREDQAFFAAGACHILAFTFHSLHADEGYEIIHIQPKENFSGHHVYVSNGTWAFDHNGWTKEEDLLTITKEAYRRNAPEWDFDRLIVTDDLESFCKRTNHRPPAYFAYLPWERAYKYIKKFDGQPPID